MKSGQHCKRLQKAHPEQLTISVPTGDRTAQEKDETVPPGMKASHDPHQLPGPQMKTAVGVVAERCSVAAALWVFKGPVVPPKQRGAMEENRMRDTVILPFQPLAIFKVGYYYELHLQGSSIFSTW